MLSFLCCLLLQALAVVDAEGVYRAYAWQSSGEFPSPSEFPESHDDSLSSRPSSAVAFTGGGSRSFISSLGYLGAFNQLALIPSIRYMLGVSGGSWATVVFSFKQVDVDDATFLGEILLPEEISMEKLEKMSPDCARALANCDFVKVTLEAVKSGVANTLADGWAHATQELYFEPVGIQAGVPFSWNEQTVADIKERNPLLKDLSFVLPSNAERPFPLIGAAIVGPDEGGGYPYDNRNMTMLEMTPLYVGQMRSLNVGYNYHEIGFTRYKTVGGLVEPFAFGLKGSGPKRGLDDSSFKELHVPAPSSFLDLQYAAGASGYAEGAFFESLKPHNLSSALGMHFDYWSPVDARPSSLDTLVCDGGSYENIMLPSMLQRGMKKIILFFNTVTPLQPASNWNVEVDPPSKNQIDDGLSSLFGVLPEDYVTWEKRSFDFSKDQFFSRDDWAPLVKDLQRAQQDGNGILVTKTLRTVENSWWGVPSGLEVEVAFVYLGRLASWEAQLSPEMRELLVPAGDAASDLSKTVDSGPFRHFPHYPTAGGLLGSEQANVLADLTAWTVLKNAEQFQYMLS